MTTMKAIDGQKNESQGLDKAQIASLKMRYGDELVRVIESGETYVFRTPSRAEFARYTSSLVKKREDLMTPAETLCVDCLVWPELGGEPDVARLRTVFERKPALSLQTARDLQGIAGGGEDADLGKL